MTYGSFLPVGKVTCKI